MTHDISALASEWLTPDDAGALLGVSKITLAAWRVKGGGPAYAKFGRSIRYPREALLKWMNSRVVASTSQAVAAE
ncbi:helix-turn-helix domain-containing protein [Methylosinus sp. LW3]|uniref:helix-turn-helix domain-containing protein n=1 Tax=Methylosinus sp. LW3 TaxID=107635 RepID=UPI000464CB70|nr:helix-turn-helix domain-containing protein [Methylosinus sp. LW3]